MKALSKKGKEILKGLVDQTGQSETMLLDEALEWLAEEHGYDPYANEGTMEFLKRVEEQRGRSGQTFRVNAEISKASFDWLLGERKSKQRSINLLLDDAISAKIALQKEALANE